MRIFIYYILYITYLLDIFSDIRLLQFHIVIIVSLYLIPVYDSILKDCRTFDKRQSFISYHNKNALFSYKLSLLGQPKFTNTSISIVSLTAQSYLTLA